MIINNKKIEREIHNYIKENLNKGYSLKAIKRAFIIHGYDPDFAEKLIKSYRIKNTIIKSSPWFLILLLLFISITFLYNPEITTLAVLTEGRNFTDNVGLTFEESSTYLWNLDNKGILKSVRLNGEVKINGSVKIYLGHDNKTYLIFDSKELKEKGLEKISGFVIKEGMIKVETEGNLTAEEQIILDSLIANINKTKNNVEIEIEKEGNTSKKIIGAATNEQELLIETFLDALKNNEGKVKIKIESEFQEIEEIINDTIINETINVTELINETNITVPLNETINITLVNITNETIINETLINKTIENISLINIKLEYKQGSAYDKDDNGIENIDSVIDLTVENTGFNWDVNGDNLCTRWETYSVEDEESTTVCYGSQKCCQFAGLLATRPQWNEPFYSAYGAYGATFNNIVSAQVIYVDYNLSIESPYAEIYYSDWQNLTAKFYKDYIRFEDVCIETCILPNLNATSYKFILEMDNSSLILDSISYEVLGHETMNNAPVLLKNLTDISISSDQSYTINLSEYFNDPDNDTLIFDFYNNSKVSITIINETALLRAGNFIGTTYTFFIANDSKDITASNVFKVEVKERKIVTGVLKSLRKLIGLG